MTKKYPITKECVTCGKGFVVQQQKARNTTCSKICGDKKATKTRKEKGHWNLGNPKKIKGILHHWFGKHHSKDTTLKISKTKKGNSPAWNKGIPTPLEAKEKMRLKKLGKRVSPKTEFKKGLTPWNKGRKCPQFSGSNNPSWKGGITPLHNKIRASVEYKLWERSVKERDKHKCQKCGEKRIGHIMAHHILNFSSHIELRTAIDNGITFCRPCHKQFHKIYGKKNNNREQVLDFIKEFYE